MADETFAEATMRKMRELEAEVKKLRIENAALRKVVEQQRDELDRRDPPTWDELFDKMRRRKPRYLCEAR